jgi:GTP-binding protein
MLIIKKAELVTSAVSREGYPDHDGNEYAFFGRSNVGKSSFINALVNRKNLAYTSQTPGKTQTLNFFNVNDQFMIVDVPGYGYSARSNDKTKLFGPMIEEYLSTRKNLKIAFLLVDLRRKPTEDDVTMYQYLRQFRFRTVIIATKADKIGTTLVAGHVNEALETLKISKDDLFVTSSATKKGIEKVHELFESNL